MEELNPTNAFGELLLDLIDAQYGGDYDSGIAAIAQAAGLAEEEVVAIVQGEVVVEDENLLSGIISAFPDADEGDIEVIINVASGVDEADRQELLGAIGSEEMEAEMPEEDMAAAYAQYQGNQAQFSNVAAQAAQAANFAAQEVQSMKQQMANFQAVQYLNNELKDLNALATRYVEANALPPSYKAMLVGNFSDDNARIARFSQMAQENGVDVGTMLFATKYALGLLTDAAEFVEFRDYSVTDEDVAIANFSANLDQVVRADIDAIFNG